MAIEYPKILMIGGNARKSGKTSFICKILSKFGTDNPIVALKIALYTDKEVLQSHYGLKKDEDFHEVRETSSSGDKDSSRYVSAGAMEGWFIAAMEDETGTEKIRERLDFLIESGRLLIIESNRMRKFIEPGLFLMVNHTEHEDKSGAKAFQQMSDLLVEPDSEEYNEIEKYIAIEEKNWVLKNE